MALIAEAFPASGNFRTILHFGPPLAYISSDEVSKWKADTMQRAQD